MCTCYLKFMSFKECFKKAITFFMSNFFSSLERNYILMKSLVMKLSSLLHRNLFLMTRLQKTAQLEKPKILFFSKNLLFDFSCSLPKAMSSFCHVQSDQEVKKKEIGNYLNLNVTAIDSFCTTHGDVIFFFVLAHAKQFFFRILSDNAREKAKKQYRNFHCQLPLTVNSVIRTDREDRKWLYNIHFKIPSGVHWLHTTACDFVTVSAIVK